MHNLCLFGNFSECIKPLESILGCFPYLRVLYLRQNPDTITDHHLWAISRSCPFLLELDLGDCAGVTDAGLAGPVQTQAGPGKARVEGIASLTRLHSLNLCRLNDNTFATIHLMTKGV
jgi:hypothetical protein